MKARALFILCFVITVRCQSIAQVAVSVAEGPMPENIFRTPEGLPEWLKGHENLLPPVSKEVMQEMTKLLNYWITVQTWEEGAAVRSPEHKAEAVKALQRIAELKEQATYAVLWMYTYERADDAMRTDQSRGRIMELIQSDPTILNYTLPFFRFRVAWFTEQFRVKNMETGQSSSEMWGLIKYLLTWGDESDKETLRVMLRLLEVNGQDNYGTREKSKDLWKLFRWGESGRFPNYLKQGILGEQRPTWELMVYGPDNERMIRLQAESAVPKPPALVKMPVGISPPKIEPATAVKASSNLRDWGTWAFVILATAAGALWFLMRTSKRDD